MSQQKKKGKLFGFLNYERFNKPDAPGEDTRPTVKRYFKLLWRRLWKLVSVNLMMWPMIIPVAIAVYIYFSSPMLATVNASVYPSLLGALTIDQSPDTTILKDLFGTSLGLTTPTVGGWIGIGVCALFLLLTYGLQNVGVTYCLRSMVRGEPVFVISDYFYAVKRNIKGGILLGIIDLGATVLLVVDYLFFSTRTGFWNDVAFFAVLALAILWFFMRMYVYLMQITFDLSLRKILKNALIFAVLGIKRNLMATLGLILVTAFHVVLFPLFALTPLGIAIPLILPLIGYFAICNFTTVYGAYPVIEKYMITPYVKKEEEAAEKTVQTDETVTAEIQKDDGATNENV